MQDDQQVTESTYLSQHHTTITDHVTAWSIIGCIYNYLISKMLQQLRNSRDSRCTDPSGKWREILFHRELFIQLFPKDTDSVFPKHWMCVKLLCAQ